MVILRQYNNSEWFLVLAVPLLMVVPLASSRVNFLLIDRVIPMETVSVNRKTVAAQSPFWVNALEALMRRAMLFIAITAAVSLAGVQLVIAQIVPQAKSSAGPALTTFGSATVVAWAGASGTARAVAYTTISNDTSVGSPPTGWSSQKNVCKACTTVAPALATAAEGLYLAIRGSSAQPADNIYYTLWSTSGAGFSATLTKLCAGTTCPETTASPALVGNTSSSTGLSSLYAAWMTAANTIDYAVLANGSWTVAPGPDVSSYPPYPNTGPALAVYNNMLYLAWTSTTACGAITYSTLPLSPGAFWSAPATVPNAKTSVAPVLFLYSSLTKSPSSTPLSLAWTAPSAAGYIIYIANWNGSTLTWNPAYQNLPKAGPMENFSPALTSYVNDTNIPCAPPYYDLIVAYTMALGHEGDIGWDGTGIVGPVPKGCSGGSSKQQ